MIHRTTPDFWECYYVLPEAVRRLADKNYSLLKVDPYHPSLHLKRIYEGLWSVRIGLKYRSLATEVDDGLVWFWIGHHAEYDRIISQ